MAGYEDEADYPRKVALVNKAINDSKTIQFMYKKRNAKRAMKRTVTPYEITSYFYTYESEYILCIRGYCHKRNAERWFAIKRATHLKILKTS